MGNRNAALHRLDKSNSEFTGRRERQASLDGPADGQSLVTPAMPIPDWMRGLDHGAARTDWLRELDHEAARTPREDHSEVDEHAFWDALPRYSVTNLPSLAPVALRPTPSRWRT
jgi:hypothetical protein